LAQWKVWFRAWDARLFIAVKQLLRVVPAAASMRRLVRVKGKVVAFAFDFSFSRGFFGFAFGLASFACSFISVLLSAL